MGFQHDPLARIKRRCVHILEGGNEYLKDVIDTLGLIDMDNINGDFTWSNIYLESHHISYLLDCFLILEPLILEGFLMETSILSME